MLVPYGTPRQRRTLVTAMTMHFPYLRCIFYSKNYNIDFLKSSMQYRF